MLIHISTDYVVLEDGGTEARPYKALDEVIQGMLWNDQG